jgi:hypothetical protein
MSRHAVSLGLLCSLALAAPAAAQAPAQAPAAPPVAPGTATGIIPLKPGRAPGQPIDSAYTQKIHEYTTESFLLSPLVD